MRLGSARNGGDVERAVEVQFRSGQDVLNAYWGYLAEGGLVIPNCYGLDEGEPIVLRIHIESMSSRHMIAGRVARLRPEDAVAVVAFSPGEPQDMLLSAALAETDHVAARVARRHPCRLAVALDRDDVGSVHMVNISRAGCCLRVPDQGIHRLRAGSEGVRMSVGDVSVIGTVRWAHKRDRGVEFTSGDPDQIAALIARLSQPGES